MLDLELSWQAAAAASGCLFAGTVVLRRPAQPRLAQAVAIGRETALLLGLFALWQFVGSFSLVSASHAIWHGEWLWHAERVIHLPSEAVIQHAFLPHPLLVQALNLYYDSLHFPVLITCLVWLFLRHRGQYPRVRALVVLFTAGSLLIQLIPVAPPRMLPDDGMVDTAQQYGQSVYGSIAGFNANQLSAMPSVHVGWALLIAVVVIAVSGSRWRWLILAYPVLTTLAVVATANHYWLDGIAAAALLAVVMATRWAWQAWRRPPGIARQARLPGDQLAGRALAVAQAYPLVPGSSPGVSGSGPASRGPATASPQAAGNPQAAWGPGGTRAARAASSDRVAGERAGHHSRPVNRPAHRCPASRRSGAAGGASAAAGGAGGDPPAAP